MQSFSIKLGMPQCGWLPFTIKIGDYSLSEEASDLGLNVIDQMADMAEKTGLNKEAECYFYLEPAAYLLKSEPRGDATWLKVQFVENFDNNDNQVAETLYQAEIDRLEFGKALIEALKEFRQRDIAEDDWPAPANWELLNRL